MQNGLNAGELQQFVKGSCASGLSNREEQQKVRNETVEYIIAHKSDFADFETDIDKSLSEKLINREWGLHLEIATMSVLYNACIKDKELSPSGEHVTAIPLM